jgi:hypothetical protein
LTQVASPERRNLNVASLTRLIARVLLDCERCGNERIWCSGINPLHALWNHRVPKEATLQIVCVDIRDLKFVSSRAWQLSSHRDNVGTKGVQPCNGEV